MLRRRATTSKKVMQEVENSRSLASFLVTASPCRRHLEETKTFMCSTPAETRVRTAARALLCCLCRFCMLRTGSMVNRSVAGRPGLDDILLLLPKLYCRDKVCQYIDWMSKTWKTIFLHDSALSHAITLQARLIPLLPSRPSQNSVTGVENAHFGRLDASVAGRQS